MTSPRASLIAGAIVVGALVGQVLIGLVETVISVIGATYDGPIGDFYAAIGTEVLQGLLRAVVLGIGFFIAFRFITPVHGEDGWRRVLITAAFATLFGTAVFVVIGVIVTLIQSTNPGEYPFGYAFTPAFSSEAAGYGVIRVVAEVPGGIVEWFSFVLVATAVQKIWLSRPQSVEPLLSDRGAKADASRVA